MRSANYRLYFFGQGISLVGTWLQVVAEQWLIYPILTNNRSLLGVVSAVNLAPTALLVLFAGVIADRVNKRRVQVLLQFFYALVAFFMSWLVATGKVQLWHVMLAALSSGIVFAFDMPTRQALMIDLVDRPAFASALSLNAGIFNAARAIGPAVGGILIATVGIAAAYFLNGLSFFAVIVSLLLMRLPVLKKQGPTVSLWRGLLEGVSYVRSHAIVAILLLLLFVTTTFTWPVATLLPVYAHDVFGKGEVGFGLLQSMFGIGACIGAFGFSKLFESIANKWRFLIVLFGLTVLYLVGFAWVTNFSVALALGVVGGWAIATAISFENTIIQLEVPDQLRGRILSFYSLVLVGGMPVGALVASGGVATLGLRTTVALSALLFSICSATVLALGGRRLRSHLAAMV